MDSREHLTAEDGCSKPCGICSGQNVSGTGISPSTANALVNVNPSELHIQ